MTATRCLGVLVLGACGGGSPAPLQIDAASADGPSLDAARDAALDAAWGPATVTVLQARPYPIPNAAVLFTAPDGVSTEAHTDATGTATGVLAPDGSVTAVLDQSNYATIANAMPGDHLTFGLGRFGTPPSAIAVSFTAYAPDATYMLYTPCYATSVTPPTSTVSVDFCDGPLTDTDVYIVATTSTTRVSAGAHHVDLTTGAVTVPADWVPFRTVELSYSGIPVNDLSANGTDVPERYTAGPGSLFSTSVSISMPTTAPAQLIQTDIWPQNAVPTRDESFIDRLAPTATSYALSAADRRPQLVSVSYDAATRTISCTAPAGLTGDVVRYFLSWGDAQSPSTWTIYARPYEPFTLPALPPDIFDFAMSPDPLISVSLIDSSSVTGWDEARPRVFAVSYELPDPADVPDRYYVQTLTNR